MEPRKLFLSSLKEAQHLLSQVLADEHFISNCEKFANMLINCYQHQGTVFSCGNGGSHCDAMHFAEELTGRYRKDRRPLGALALGDASHVTCVANDYGFEHIFARQIEGLGRRGDVLIGLSTSGNSKNVCLAFEAAKKQGMQTVALLGRDGGVLKELADLALIVPAQTSDRIQEVHIKLIHTVIESVERRLFPENYSDS